jgi:hypothetical protein
VRDGRIDIHTHFLPAAYRAVLARHGLDAIAGTKGRPARYSRGASRFAPAEGRGEQQSCYPAASR